MRLSWTKPAISDLTSIRAYIAADHPAAARRQSGYILQSVRQLRRFPAIGRPGRISGTRELVIPNTPYIVGYRFLGETIEILRVLHARQRWPDSL